MSIGWLTCIQAVDRPLSLLLYHDSEIARRPPMPIASDASNKLLQILEDRYGKKSTIITSQLPVGSWYEYINESTIADAIMDRLSASAHRFELKGESLRKKNIK